MSLRRQLIVDLSTILFLFIVTGIVTADGIEKWSSNSSFQITTHRKLLNHGLETARENQNGKEKLNTTVVEPNRIWSEKCSTSDIMITQGATQPLPSGIPTYTVEIMNVGISGNDISNIHLSCGWFSSARIVNPKVIRRIKFDDCLVNDGNPLSNGHTLSFQYANTYSYPLTVTSVSC